MSLTLTRTHAMALSLMLLYASAAHASTAPQQPVQYGGSGDHARCNMAVVENGADTPAPLRTRPADDAAVLANINSSVYICDASDDGQWLGVIVQPPGEQADACLADTLPRQHQAYRGPCRSGWVDIAHMFFLEEG